MKTLKIAVSAVTAKRLKFICDERNISEAEFVESVVNASFKKSVEKAKERILKEKENLESQLSELESM